MISQDQLHQLTKKYQMHNSIVAREFVQLSFLKELYQQNFAKKIFFKGGTAIRILFGGKRFSEDLDFTVLLEELIFIENISKFFKTISNLYPFNFRERKTLTGKTYLLTAEVPHIKSKVFVKLDFSMRENVIEPTKNIIQTDYPVIISSFIPSLSKNEILAEKIRAFLKRVQPRDLYDLWILQELGASFDKTLIERKLAYYDEKLDKKTMLKRLDTFYKNEFIKDLRPFVPIGEREKLGNLFDFVKEYVKMSFENL